MVYDMLWSDPAAVDPVPASPPQPWGFIGLAVLPGLLRLAPRKPPTFIECLALGWAQERSTMLDAQGFGLSPRGCRSFGEAAVDLFLALHRFQHVFRVCPRSLLHTRLLLQ